MTQKTKQFSPQAVQLNTDKYSFSAVIKLEQGWQIWSQLSLETHLKRILVWELQSVSTTSTRSLDKSGSRNLTDAKQKCRCYLMSSAVTWNSCDGRPFRRSNVSVWGGQAWNTSDTLFLASRWLNDPLYWFRDWSNSEKRRETEQLRRRAPGENRRVRVGRVLAFKRLPAITFVRLFKMVTCDDLELARPASKSREDMQIEHSSANKDLEMRMCCLALYRGGHWLSGKSIRQWCTQNTGNNACAWFAYLKNTSIIMCLDKVPLSKTINLWWHICCNCT